MKGMLIKRAVIFLIVLVVTVSFFLSSCFLPKKKKSRFSGNRCADCHQQKLQEYLSKPNVHQPVKENACDKCHESHGYIGSLHLWEEGKSALCFRCHPEIQALFSRQTGPSGGSSPSVGGKGQIHSALRNDKCTLCHDPHSSGNRALIVESVESGARAASGSSEEGAEPPEGVKGAESAARAKVATSAAVVKYIKNEQDLCFACHEEKGFQKPYLHKPIEGGCPQCHLPHASEHSNLLAVEERDLCLKCHPDQDGVLASAHQGYPVANSNCSNCHNSHSSETPSLLHDYGHKPLLGKECSRCHLPADSGNPLGVKAKAGELCFKCHKQKNADSGHKPMKEGECLLCHTPHASNRAGLLSVPESDGCYQCHKTIQKESLEEKVVHQPIKDGQCTFCHDHHDGKMKWGGMSQRDFCWQCHSQAMQIKPGDVIHGPVEKGECLTCHSNHASSIPGMLSEASPQLCYKCHTQDKERFEKITAHTPVRKGECLSCHTAHISQDKGLLAKSSKDLCLTCHSSLNKELEPDHIHPGIGDGQCMECHEPHVTDFKNMLSYDNGRLCLTNQCHQPLGEAMLARNGIVHTPLKNFQCVACHNPHGSKIDHQLLTLTNKLCFSCHTGMQEKIKSGAGKIHAPVAEGKCMVCHQEHTATVPFLLIKEGDVVCLDCHKKEDPNFKSAHGNIGFKGGHCLECHSPHYSDSDKLFRQVVHKPFQSNECQVCHQGATKSGDINEEDDSRRHRR